jgi:hypothetical protein
MKQGVKLMKKHIFIAGLLFITLAITACTPGIPLTGGTEPIDANLVADQQATIAALETEVAVTSSAAPSSTLVPTSTPTSVPTNTLVFTATPTAKFPTSTPTAVPTAVPVYTACNLAAFVGDVTYADGTVVNANDAFVKTWALRNIGTCTWTTGYQIVLTSGGSLSGATAAYLPVNVYPGQTVDISLTLTAPATAGTYENFYRLADANGNQFGLGTSNGSFDVLVSVGASSTALAVTHVGFTVDNSVVTVTCPAGYTFLFSADIVTNNAGSVTYHWIFSDGTTSPQQTLVFSDAGTQTVTAAWTLGADGTLPTNPYAGSASVYIDDPNHQNFGPVPVAIGCIFPTPTTAPTSTPTMTPTALPTQLPSVTPTATSTLVPSATPTMTATAVPTLVPSTTPTAASTKLPTLVPSVTPTSTPTATLTPTLTPTPTKTKSQ